MSSPGSTARQLTRVMQCSSGEVLIPQRAAATSPHGMAAGCRMRVTSGGISGDRWGTSERPIVSRQWTTIDSLVRSMFQPVPLTGFTVNALPIQAKLPWPLSHAGRREGCFQMWDCLRCTGNYSPATVDPNRVSSYCKHLPCSTAASTLLLLPKGTTVPWNPQTVFCCSKCSNKRTRVRAACQAHGSNRIWLQVSSSVP
jgi:hypothetical protein